MPGQGGALQLDHVVIAVHDLETAMRDYRGLGFTVREGGVHANRATCNALITFADGTYLELLAATGEPPLSGLVDFGRLLVGGEGLVGFALRSPDLDGEAARLRTEGFSVGAVIPGERRRTDGTPVQWKLALLADGFAPFFIQDVTPQEYRIPRVPALITHANGARGLHGVEIAVRNLPGAAERYARLFGLPPRSSGEGLAVGEVILREGAADDSQDVLAALHLAFASPGDVNLPAAQTHGVTIRPVPARG